MPLCPLPSQALRGSAATLQAPSSGRGEGNPGPLPCRHPRERRAARGVQGALCLGGGTLCFLSCCTPWASEGDALWGLVPHGVKQEWIQCLQLLLGNLEPWQRGIERACPETPETKAPACPGAAALPGVCCRELTVPVLVLRSSRRVPWTAWAWRCAGCEPSCR